MWGYLVLVGNYCMEDLHKSMILRSCCLDILHPGHSHNAFYLMQRHRTQSSAMKIWYDSDAAGTQAPVLLHGFPGQVAVAPHRLSTREEPTLQMAVRQVRTSRSGSVRRRQAATLRPRIMMRRTSLGDACSCKRSNAAISVLLERYQKR